MRLRPYFRFAARSIVMIAAIAYAGNKFASDPGLAKKYGGQRVLAVLAKPDEVTAHLLRPFPPERQGRAAPLEDYETRGEPVAVPEELEKRLSEFFTSPKRFDLSGAAVGCLPNYGVRLAFLQGDDQVDVLICFECGTILVYRNEKRIGGGLFKGTPTDLIEVVKELFPEDRAIQSLEK